jgi:dTDP-4-amino-4,6-dideoxygalactose transaminase
VIDDAAQALGSRSQDGQAGALGDVGLLSFGMTKHISCGNAALLFHDAQFAAEVEAVLDTLSPESMEVRASLNTAFRLRLDAARARLRKEGDSAASAFAGLLEGLERTLYALFATDVVGRMLVALDKYSAGAQARIDKANIWASHLAQSGFTPVGMGAGSVPWRYVCRLPDITWQRQQTLADAMRVAPMHVSNWYLPASWFVGRSAGTLPGVERLSREVFQFWLDDTVTAESIVRQAAAVRQAVNGNIT